MVQSGACCGVGGATEAVGGTVSDGTGIFTGFDEGFMRNTAATMITRMMMPLMMIQGRRDLFDIR